MGHKWQSAIGGVRLILRFHGRLATFSDCGDLGRQLQRQHDQRFTAVSAEDEGVGAGQPIIQALETVRLHLDLDAAIEAEHWHGEIMPRVSGARGFLRSETAAV